MLENLLNIVQFKRVSNFIVLPFNISVMPM